MRGKKQYDISQEYLDLLYSTKGMSKKTQKEKYLLYLKHLRKSAYNGYPEAQFELGLQFEELNFFGYNNPLFNSKKSFYWYSKACSNNVAGACNNLALLYETGRGTKKNLIRALELYNKGCQLGDMNVCDNLAILIKQLNQTGSDMNIEFKNSMQKVNSKKKKEVDDILEGKEYNRVPNV